MADIPGLIKGSSQGIGLGHEFIRHIERTKLLIHIIDGAGANGTAPLEAYKTIQEELKAYDKDRGEVTSPLLKKKQMLVINKSDLLSEKDFKELLPDLEVLVTTVDLNTRKINVIK